MASDRPSIGVDPSNMADETLDIADETLSFIDDTVVNPWNVAIVYLNRQTEGRDCLRLIGAEAASFLEGVKANPELENSKTEIGELANSFLGGMDL